LSRTPMRVSYALVLFDPSTIVLRLWGVWWCLAFSLLLVVLIVLIDDG